MLTIYYCYCCCHWSSDLVPKTKAKCTAIRMGYWPSVRSRWLEILFCMFTHWDEVEVHKLAKKRMRPISSHLDRTYLAKKGFIIWFSGKFFWGDTAGIPEWPRWLHLARSGSQSQCAIWVILAARGASHKIREIIKCRQVPYVESIFCLWWRETILICILIKSSILKQSKSGHSCICLNLKVAF